VRARARIARITRVRADLGALRCADNLRCAPPTGLLVGVPFHNELRVSIGGPLVDDMGIGSSRRQKLLLRGLRDMTFRPIQARFSAHARASCSDRIREYHSDNTSNEKLSIFLSVLTAHWPQRPRRCSFAHVYLPVGLAFHERVHENCAAPRLTRGRTFPNSPILAHAAACEKATTGINPGGMVPCIPFDRPSARHWRRKTLGDHGISGPRADRALVG
jgi:hypothetical protein